jgi:hypothetical protein
MHRLLRLASAVFLLAYPRYGNADIVTVDQESAVRIGEGYGIQALSPLGQEFVPNLPFVDAVELHVTSISEVPTDVPSVTLLLRQGSIDGPLLASSAPAIAPIPPGAVVTFTLPRTPLVPGDTYVIQVTSVSRRDVVAMSLDYPRGQFIAYGRPTETGDLWFREGVNEIVATATTTWRAVKILYR